MASFVCNKKNEQLSEEYVVHERRFVFTVKISRNGVYYSGKDNKESSYKYAQIYLSGTNLLTFSKFKLWDVEMGGKGLGYPVQMVINAGVQLNF